MLWFPQLLPVLHIGAAGNRTASTGSERAGFPAAPFGKTPAAEGLTECDFLPAEFFFAHCYQIHAKHHSPCVFISFVSSDGFSSGH